MNDGRLAVVNSACCSTILKCISSRCTVCQEGEFPYPVLFKNNGGLCSMPDNIVLLSSNLIAVNTFSILPVKVIPISIYRIYNITKYIFDFIFISLTNHKINNFEMCLCATGRVYTHNSSAKQLKH